MRKSVLVALVAAIVGLSSAAATAQYGQESGSLSVSDTSISPGGSVTVSGSGFAPGSGVEITIESTPQRLANVTAGSQGGVSATVTIPSGMAGGTHTLKATGVTPDGATLVLSANVTVLAAGAGDLAGTGAQVTWLVVALSLLLAFGIGVLWMNRRRARA